MYRGIVYKLRLSADSFGFVMSCDLTISVLKLFMSI